MEGVFYGSSVCFEGETQKVESVGFSRVSCGGFFFFLATKLRMSGSTGVAMFEL